MPSTEIPISGICVDSPTPVEHSGTKLVVFRSRDTVFAYYDRCPHAFWPLSQGTLKNNVLECPGHGWEFDVETGRCLSAPVYCLRPVTVKINGDTVHLEWPEHVS